MDKISEIIAEPSLGQIDQLEYLCDSSITKNAPYISYELDLENVHFEAMEKTISFFVKRHESLRTIFPLIDGEIKQVILPYDKDRFRINYLNTENEANFLSLKNEVYRDVCAGFSALDKGPLVRFFLFKREDGMFFFSILIHHLLCDAWSLNVIEKDLFEIYHAYLSDEEPVLIPLTIQLRDYCRDLNSNLMENKVQTTTFWANKLKEIEGLLDLERFYKSYTSRTGKPVVWDTVLKFNSQQELVEILDQQDAAVYTSLIIGDKLSIIKNIASQHYCTVSAILYASFYLFIFIYTGKSKILLAALIADRSNQDKASLIGCLLGGIYLPKTLYEETVVDNLIQETFFNLLEGIQNIIYNHEFLEIDGELLRVNCDVYLNYIVVDKSLGLADHNQLNTHREDEGIYYALNCMLCEYNNYLSIKWRYNKGLYTKEVIEDMVKCYEEILDLIIENNQFAVKDMVAFFNLNKS